MDNFTFFTPKYWAKDHWSMLQYLADAVENTRGVINIKPLRVNKELRGFPDGKRWTSKDATIVKGDKQPKYEHDDLDCIINLGNEGYIDNRGTTTNPIIDLTPKGKIVLRKLRAHLQKGNGGYNNFKFQ